MSITMRPANKSIEDFINAAPDAGAEKGSIPKKTNRRVGNQVAISLALPADLLFKVDESAKTLSLTRAGFIKQALARALQV